MIAYMYVAKVPMPDIRLDYYCMTITDMYSCPASAARGRSRRCSAAMVVESKGIYPSHTVPSNRDRTNASTKVALRNGGSAPSQGYAGMPLPTFLRSASWKTSISPSRQSSSGETHLVDRHHILTFALQISIPDPSPLASSHPVLFTPSPSPRSPPHPVPRFVTPSQQGITLHKLCSQTLCP